MDKDLLKFSALETISKNFLFFYTRLFKTYQILDKSYNLDLDQWDSRIYQKLVNVYPKIVKNLLKSGKVCFLKKKIQLPNFGKSIHILVSLFQKSVGTF